MRDVRKYGVTELLVYRADLVCNHCGRLSLAPFPDDLVLLTLDPRCRCTKCVVAAPDAVAREATSGLIGRHTPVAAGPALEASGRA